MSSDQQGGPVLVESVKEELRAQAREWVIETCRAQGLPVKISDPGVIRKVVAILNEARQEREQLGRGDRARG